MDGAKYSNSLTAIVRNYALFEIFLLGILSGMPFSILYTIILVMMKDMGVELAIVTSLAFVKLPYSLKFLWSPLIDGIRIPIFHKFGRRKSWMLLITFINILILIAIISLASKENFRLVQLLGLMLGFGAASYDIAYDAWRIERIEKDLQAMCGAVAVFGYRMGALLTSAGVMYLVGATGDNWYNGFVFIIILFAVFFLFIISVSDKKIGRSTNKGFDFKKNVIDPFKNFLTKPNALLILLAITLYKAGEAMLGYVSVPFLLEIGFTKMQIASIAKIFGVIATTLGTFAGGAIVYKIGPIRGLLVCGIVQMVANLTYIWLHSQGPEFYALLITIAVDNFTGGMGMAALVGFLGTLCNREYTATQYALLSSSTTFVNNSLNAYSGEIVTSLGWNNFFIFTVILSLPALFILLYLIKKGRKSEIND